MAKPYLVHVWWVDSCTMNGWRHLSEMPDADMTTHCETVGWLLKKNDKELVVGGSVGDLDMPNAQANSIMVIPRVAVTKMRRIKENK